MKTRLGRVMDQELFVEENGYSDDFKEFIIGNDNIDVCMKR